MGKTEGIFLNLQCDCHRVASMFIKLMNLYTNFSTLLPNVTALWINGVSLNSLAHTFFYRSHRPKGPFKCYVTQLGVGGCQVFRKIALRRCNIQRY